MPILYLYLHSSLNKQLFFMRLLTFIAILSLLWTNLATQEKAPKKGLKLVWQDEFNQGDRPDITKWRYDLGNGQNGWGNNELEYYSSDPSNVRIQNGHLILEAHKVKQRDTFYYSSGKILTHDKAAWTYGRFEIRAKLPKGLGTWPAIWMLGDNIVKEGWPTCGEIDIMEEVGKFPNEINWSAHSKLLNWPLGTQKTNKAMIQNADSTFHVYRLDWTKAKLEFYVDNQLYYTVFNEGKGKDYYPFVAPQFLILNLAIGGNMAGNQIDDTQFPVKMEVDYVRVYQ